MPEFGTGIMLDDKIVQILDTEADRRGITRADLIRWVLGSWATGEMHEMRSPYRPTLAPSPGEPAPDFLGGMGAGMAKMVRMSQAAMGALTCENCSRKLSVGDVERGSCKCEAPID